MKELLKKLKACQEVIIWAGDKSWEEVYNTCHRGDWLLWLFSSVNPDDLQILTLAKGHCANTVRHLITDERSIEAIDMSIAFGNGNETFENLAIKYRGAAYAVAAIVTNVTISNSIAYATYAAANSSSVYSIDNVASDAAYAAYYASAVFSTDAACAMVKNQKETADICRKYLPFHIWNININSK